MLGGRRGSTTGNRKSTIHDKSESEVTVVQNHVSDRTDSDAPRRQLISRVWPTALGVLIAAGIGYGLADGRDIAPAVAASGLVYLVAAAVGWPGAAWPAFAVTFVLITVAKFTGLDATAWIIGLAAVLLVVGLVRRRIRPLWSLPLQSVAMLVLAAIALLAMQVDATTGGLLVASALLGHAGWDLYHHRTGRVVSRSLAEFCGVLDVLVAIVVAVVTLAT